MVLITFEGIDGSGKSTLVKKMSEMYPKAVVTKEPQNKEFIKEHSDSFMGEMFAYMLDHAKHNEYLRLIHRREIILCDRYIDSRIAYQSVRLHLNPELIRSFHFESLEPDFTFVLIIDVDKALDRLMKRDGKFFFTDKYHMTDGEYKNAYAIYRMELQKVQDEYIKMCLADKYHHAAIDVNNKSLQDITDIVDRIIQQKFLCEWMNAGG